MASNTLFAWENSNPTNTSDNWPTIYYSDIDQFNRTFHIPEAHYIYRPDPNGSNSTGTANNTNTGFLGTGVNFDQYVNKMKELAQWQLGIDKQAMGNAYDFRNREANRDYGFQYNLAGQQITGQKDLKGMDIASQKYLQSQQLASDKLLKGMDIAGQKDITGMQITGQKELQGQQIEGTSNLERLRNEYMNKRQTEQLENQRRMQESGFSQQNKLLTDNSSRARSLFFGR